MKLKRMIEVDVPVGMYLVEFTAVWGTSCNEGEHTDCLKHGCMDNEPSYVAEVEAEVVKVTVENMRGEGLDLNSNTDFTHDDTHDLRPRVFKTKREAEAHARAVVEQFRNPLPWQSFIKF